MIFAKNPSLTDINRALDEAFAAVVKRPLRELDGIEGMDRKGKISAEAVQLARIMAAEGQSQKVIAWKLRVSRNALWKRGIARRRGTK